MRAGQKLCALPLSLVRETMRPLPIEALAGTPPFVCGWSVVRGVPVPVLDLELLLSGTHAEGERTRLVTLSTSNGQTLALVVDEVLGVLVFDSASFHALPELLADPSQLTQSVASRGQQLLLALDASRLVPEEIWQTMSHHARAG